MIKILIGGSPCTYWSIAQKERETEATGQGWELFKNYLTAKEKFQPDFFLYENNHSISKAIKNQITKCLGVENQTINSALVSAQERKREYWYNSEEKNQPEDLKITLQSVITSGIAEREKSHCLDASYFKGGNIKSYFVKHRRTQIFETESNGKNSFEVKNGIVTIEGKEYKTNLQDGVYWPRNMSEIEAARLQTMPDNYCKSVNKTAAIKCFGNGWTANVIIFILQQILKDVSLDEDIVVLSMYDGIATGRYCLEKLGFKNVKYYAYEIEETAIRVALDNYPDIIEMGDAFQVREENWYLPEMKKGGANE